MVRSTVRYRLAGGAASVARMAAAPSVDVDESKPAPAIAAGAVDTERRAPHEELHLLDSFGIGRIRAQRHDAADGCPIRGCRRIDTGRLVEGRPCLQFAAA